MGISAFNLRIFVAFSQLYGIGVVQSFQIVLSGPGSEFYINYPQHPPTLDDGWPSIRCPFFLHPYLDPKTIGLLILPLNSDGLQPGHHMSTASASQSCTGSPSTNLAPGPAVRHRPWTCPEMGHQLSFGDHILPTDSGFVLVCVSFNKLIHVDTHVGS